MCDLEFGPTKSIQLVASDRTRALVEFVFIAHAVKAMLASLPKSEMGEGGVVFGQGRRFVFEPKKRTVLALYRDARKTTGHSASAVGPSEVGARYDCGMYVCARNNPLMPVCSPTNRLQPKPAVLTSCALSSSLTVTETSANSLTTCHALCFWS